MVIRHSPYPRLPRVYWGEIIYATPGSGKTFVANKYRDVVDADELIVEAIRNCDRKFVFDVNYDDPRTVIFEYFKYIRFSPYKRKKVYKYALRKMREACDINDVVLLGTRDLIDEADRIFVQQNEYIVRANFKQHIEEEKVDDLRYEKEIHYIDEYLDNSLQKSARSSNNYY